MSAERFLVASILAAPQSIHAVKGRVPVEAIRDQTLRAVYAAAVELAEDGQVPSAAALSSIKGFDIGRLVEIASAADDGRDAQQLAELVAGAHLGRRLQAIAANAAIALSDVEPHRAKQHASDLIAAIVAELTAGGDAGHMVTMREAVATAIGEIREAFRRRDAGEPPRGYTTGLSNLDDMLGEGGPLPGQMFFIGAGPGTGKTALALGMVRAAAAQRPSQAHIYITGETWAAQLARRHIAAGAGLEMAQLKADRSATADEVGSRIHAWMQTDRAVPSNVLIVDKPKPSVGDILAAIYAARSRFDIVGMVVVDHLHLMRHRHGDTDEPAIRHTIESLHAVAHQERPALVVPAQLNRSRKDHPGVPPMTTMRGAGAIEEFAHQVLMLARDPSDDPDAAEKIIIGNIDKNRDGRMGPVRFRFHGPTQRVREVGSEFYG